MSSDEIRHLYDYIRKLEERIIALEKHEPVFAKSDSYYWEHG